MEVKIEVLDSNWGPVLRVTEKKSKNPRFFDVIIDLASAQYIFFLQSRAGQKKVKEDLLFEILNVCGIKIKEVRITDYKDEKIISEIIVSAPNKADQTINSKSFVKGIAIGLTHEAKILVSQDAWDKIIAASQKAAEEFIEKTKKRAAEDYKALLKELEELNQIPISSPQKEGEEKEFKDKSII